jgi:DNA modification methylase
MAENPVATVYQGDCLETLRQMPAESVHCVVTSPPYFGLRDYSCAGQIGLEETPEAHIEALVEVFREVKRVLRTEGSLWLNYGDAYAGSWGNQGRKEERGTQRPINGPMMQNLGAGYPAKEHNSGAVPRGLKPKDLIMLPHRLAIALQADGWWVRSDIVWAKPNPMPESVTDRPTRSHEYLFLLTKSERYYYDADAIREKHQDVNHPVVNGKFVNPKAAGGVNSEGYVPVTQAWNGSGTKLTNREYNPAGRNKRTVWTIATEAYSAAHFATFPRKLVEPCILAGTSAEGVCASCGSPFVRQVEKVKDASTREARGKAVTSPRHDGNAWNENGGRGFMPTVSTENGWAQSCSCPPAPAVPCTVLDCFAGSGTVGEVALSLGRSAVLCELSKEYCKLIEKRLSRAQIPLALGI